jgi:hypothetical protein
MNCLPEQFLGMNKYSRKPVSNQRALTLVGSSCYRTPTRRGSERMLASSYVELSRSLRQRKYAVSLFQCVHPNETVSRWRRVWHPLASARGSVTGAVRFSANKLITTNNSFLTHLQAFLTITLRREAAVAVIS